MEALKRGNQCFSHQNSCGNGRPGGCASHRASYLPVLLCARLLRSEHISEAREKYAKYHQYDSGCANNQIPVQCEYYALEGISELVHTIDLVKANLNTDLNVCGIFLTMYDKENIFTKAIELGVAEWTMRATYMIGMGFV